MAGDDLLQAIMTIPSVDEPSASPTGEHVSILWGCPATFHILNVESRKPIPVGDGEIVPDAVLWHPTEERLFYQQKESDQTVIYRTSPDGEVHQVCTTGVDAQIWDVSPNGRHLYTRTNEKLWRYNLSENQRESVLEDVPFFDGYGPDPGGVSPDAENIAYTVSDEGGEGTTNYIANADGSGSYVLDLGADSSTAVIRDWSPDGERLLLADHPSLGHTGVYHLDREEMEWFTSDIEPSMPGTPGDGTERPVVFRPDGNSLLADRAVGWVGRPVVYDLEGYSRELDVPGLASLSLSVPRQGIFLDESEVLLHRETETRPGDLLRYDTETDDIEPLFDAGCGDIDADTLTTPRRTTYETANGGLGEVLVYDSGERPSPVVAELYGPRRRLKPQFERHIQYLVAEGYTVVQPIHPGEHLTPAEHANYAAVGRWLKSLDWIDENRVAALGHSHGGHDVYMQLVRYPEVWTAGVTIAGLADLFAYVEDGEGLGFLQDYLGDPTENEGAWREQSPIEHTGGLNPEAAFPLLVVHTEQDHLAEPDRAFCDALVSEGWQEGEDFEFVTIDQGHVTTNAEERIERWQPIGDFLSRRI